MARSYWSDPHPRHVTPAPIVVVLSTLGFCAVAGYEITKGVIGVWEWATGRRL